MSTKTKKKKKSGFAPFPIIDCVLVAVAGGRIPPSSSSSRNKVMARRRVKQPVYFHSGPDDRSFNIPSQPPTVYYYSGPDCFNKLHDDIIIHRILTLLDLKERMKTSLLSRGWRNLWRHTLGGNLVFPHGLEDPWHGVFHHTTKKWLPSGCRFDCRHVQQNRIPYIKWVDSTLRYFAATELDCFSVSHELDSGFSPVVHRWLVHAVRLGVKKLHLNLGPFEGRSPVNNCEFPSVDKLSSLFHVDLNAYPGYTLGISHLKELSLESINIAGQTVQYLLSSCPLLEFMSLKKAACRYLTISGPSLKLKYLHVLGCFSLEKLDISAPNLITLKYDGSKEALFFTSVPRLEHLGMTGTYFKQFCGILWQRPWPHFGDYFCQLKSLEFEMTWQEIEESASFPLELPVLVNLEEVKVKIDASPHLVFIWPCCLLKSAPRLKRFMIEHRGEETSSPSLDKETYESMTKTMEEATRCKHPCLKVVEYVGFDGSVSHHVLALHLVLCAKSLEKLVFDTGGKPELMQRYLHHYKSHLRPDAQVVVL